ncbi:tRNA (N6-isopentenyl adenosine(37)-C2)-methylthiotransferase MiaB [Flexilinea flocculi]|jgi:tRNA-2-methylthio-N6-dimethylallyladenosine synthase|nr:tRNA (N6-isopentenyl adenosine(37)-C2)-methylthiotransferase MiaB [Flexilinea flocculi]NMB92951.1 tRNA (N6-isopentenyl adenosine(37)-C2)-methylthiotransferase MiaB [Flexilinea flocculi]
MKYYIWTEGCQMNVADSQRLASAFEQLGYTASEAIENADVIILNTCMVRQSAEDKALGRLSSLKPLKIERPDLIIGLMGCMVGTKDQSVIRKKLPYVDVFAPPSDPKPIIDYLLEKELQEHDQNENPFVRQFTWESGELLLPESERRNPVSAYIPIVYGCSHACAYCIIPYKRGVERSRDPQEILDHARSLARQGVKEVTLLGQIIDRYAKDRPDYPTLAQLLEQIHEIDGIERIRFLTSHPNWMTDDLLDVVNRLPKVMRHIEVPAQAGNDVVLQNMHRGYTDAAYRALIAKIREKIPGVSIGTDIIVGFPGETEEQFEDTVSQLRDLKLNVVHLARYSPRTGTLSERTMVDDVPDSEKWRRFRVIEKLQEGIAAEIHQKLLDQTLPVLFEEKKKNRWVGRTENMDLVFVESQDDLTGKIIPVKISWTGPWTLIGTIAG